MNLPNKALLPVLTLALATSGLFAQELPRPSMAKHETTSALPGDYTMKLGPVLLNTNASIEAEYVDNINLASSGGKYDFILTPQVGVSAMWPVNAENTLRFSTSIGYSKYLIHPQYDQSIVLIAPDSVLSYDVYIGDFKINFHDQFSYQQDPTSVGALSNVVNFNRFQNTAGIGGIWDLNKLMLTLNYDHINFISEDLENSAGVNLTNPSNVSYSADQVSASAYYRITSTFVGGFEAAASLREYDHNNIEDNGLSVGPFLRLEVTPNFKLSASGGYQELSTDSGNLSAATAFLATNVSPALGIGTDNSYYVNLTLDHRLNKYYTDRLAFGHELELDVFSQVSDVSYVSYTSSWKLNNSLNIATTLNYQDVTSPSLGGSATPTFNIFSAAVQASFPVTKSISGAVLYQFADKFNTPANQGYKQNQIGLLMDYRF